MCYRVAARRPVPSFSGAVCPPFSPLSLSSPWTLKKTWFIFGPRQSSSIRSFLTARLAFPRPESNARSGAMPKKSSSSCSRGLRKVRSERDEGKGRRAESRRKTRLLCGVTLEWQLEGLMIPSRESHRESLLRLLTDPWSTASSSGALPAGRKSSRLDRASGVASAFINQCYVRLAST